MPKTLDWPIVGDLDDLNAGMKELLVTLRRFSPVANLEFFQNTVPAGQTDISLDPGLGSILEIPMPRAGHVIGIAVHSGESRTAGTLDIFATIDGTKTSDSATLDGTNTDDHQVRTPKDLDHAFEAGALIGAVITTDGSWAPTSADIMASILVQFSMED